MKSSNDTLIIGDSTFSSRLFVGTGKFSSGEVLAKTLTASKSELVTVAMKRADIKSGEDSILSHLDQTNHKILPNTSGVRNAKEAIWVAQMAREA